MRRSQAVRLGKAKAKRLGQLIAPRDYPKLLQSKVERIFPDCVARMRACAILAQYGNTEAEPEAERVRLAILKLSGGSLKKIESLLPGAKEDFEDIISWAERPVETRYAFANRKLNSPELSKLQVREQREYDQWLRKG